MKVALDATPLTEPTGGIRRYTMELANALARLEPRDEIILVSDQSYQQPGIPGVRCVRQSSGKWWSVGLPLWLRRERADIFHGTDFSVPYLPLTPSVMTLHDLSPWRTGGSDRVRRRTPWLLRFGLPSMIITPSESVRREAMEMFRLPAEEVAAIPLAAATHFQPLEISPARGSYFLFVGTIEPRKNISRIIEAVRELRRQGLAVELHLAGRARAGSELPQGEGIRFLGEVAEEELPKLYAGACAVLYPSLYEGFGLPVLEAMQSGAMVIASRDPAVMETAGDGCICLDACDTAVWVEALRAAWTNGDLRQQWKDRSLRRAAQFSWQKTAALTREVYATAMRRFHG